MSDDPFVASGAAGWDTAREVPRSVLVSLDRSPGEIVAIVATTDPDGAPRTAAFGSVRSRSPRTLRMGCNRSHQTYANIVRDGRVMIAVYADPDVAVGIKGRATVVKEQMETLDHDAIIEIEVEEVKNDLLPSATMKSGITYSVSKETAGLISAYNREVES